MRIAASGMVGQQVSYLDQDGVTQTGIATAVSFETAVPIVTVGEARIPLDAVSALGTASTPPPSTAPTPADPTTPDPATTP
jgi:flagellar basal-body rod modification protein FlgD